VFLFAKNIPSSMHELFANNSCRGNEIFFVTKSRINECKAVILHFNYIDTSILLCLEMISLVVPTRIHSTNYIFWFCTAFQCKVSAWKSITVTFILYTCI